MASSQGEACSFGLHLQPLAMINLLRRFQQPLLITLTVLVIIAFVVLYGGPGTRLDRLGSDSVGVIYGRNVPSVEYGAIGRQFEICRALGMFDVLIPLSGNARTMQDAVDNYVWNTLVLRQQARKMGILPTENEITETIKSMSAFKSSGQYDHSRYLMALQSLLAPRGMNAMHLEELVRDVLRLQALRNVLAASSAPARDELEQAYSQQYQKVEASVVRVSKEEIAKTVSVSAEDLQSAFEARKDGLKTDEKRKVEYVHFELPKGEKEGERPSAEAMQKVVDKAADFAAAMMEQTSKSEDLAKQFEVEFKTSPMFAMGERLQQFSNQPRVVNAAFQLTKEKPVSDIVGTPQGYFVVKLLEVQDARPLSFEEAKAQLEERLKSERTREALSLKASEARGKIDEALKAGKGFAAAAEAAGLKAEAIEPFSRGDSSLKVEDASVIQNSALELKDGQLSAPLDGKDGSLIVFLSKKLPINEEDFEKQKAGLMPMLETGRVDGLLVEWIDRQRASSGLQMTMQARGSVQ